MEEMERVRAQRIEEERDEAIRNARSREHAEARQRDALLAADASQPYILMQKDELGNLVWDHEGFSSYEMVTLFETLAFDMRRRILEQMRDDG